MVEVLHRFFPQYSDQIVQPTDCSPSAEESTEGPKCGEKRSLSFRSRDFRTENDFFCQARLGTTIRWSNPDGRFRRRWLHLQQAL